MVTVGEVSISKVEDKIGISCFGVFTEHYFQRD